MCLVIRSGFEPETHSLEGCCSIQLSYQTLVGMRLSHERRLSASLGRPRFLLLTQRVIFTLFSMFMHAKLPVQAH